MSRDNSRHIKGAHIVYSSLSPDKFLNDTHRKNFVFFDKNPSKSQYLYIEHPYKSDFFTIVYDSSEFLDTAKRNAQEKSLDKKHPTASLIVSKGTVISSGENGSDYHDKHGCKRKELGIPTGEGYDLCEGCHPRNHAEATAVRNLELEQKQADESENAPTAYLYGHWWLCKPCSTEFQKINVKKVILSKQWTKEFLEI